ncbi:hypothetical protein PanWU01x14_102620 [Parasponia andersonii]|uniref:Uncharacterized protein n=1 Tax=Parasponia andersonii TaxID=3476 RepID=A0A2P5D2D0_PARAD|nr:hypothetical protein PanWU01x14_102620 [Parasponia andersonii]
MVHVVWSKVLRSHKCYMRPHLRMMYATSPVMVICDLFRRFLCDLFRPVFLNKQETYRKRENTKTL